jgi:outer membrane protein TolC
MKYLLLLFALPIFGQKSVLDEYVATAFQQNITLQQKSIQVEKAMIALKTAQSLYQPSVAFQGGYQTGEGGRSIAFPVGDLLKRGNELLPSRLLRCEGANDDAALQ